MVINNGGYTIERAIHGPEEGKLHQTLATRLCSSSKLQESFSSVYLAERVRGEWLTA
jgi:hypothetical protein